MIDIMKPRLKRQSLDAKTIEAFLTLKDNSIRSVAEHMCITKSRASRIIDAYYKEKLKK